MRLRLVSHLIILLLFVSLSGCGSGGSSSITNPAASTDSENAGTGTTGTGNSGADETRNDVLVAINQARAAGEYVVPPIMARQLRWRGMTK